MRLLIKPFLARAATIAGTIALTIMALYLVATSAVAQQVVVIFGLNSGAPKAITVDASGNMNFKCISGCGSVGGSPNQVQYNNAGALGGISGVTSDGTGLTLLTWTGGSVVKPTADSTTAFKFTKADGTTPVYTVDTTNAKTIYPDGSTPSLVGTAQATTGWGFNTANSGGVILYASGTPKLYWQNPSFQFASDQKIVWENNTNASSGSNDTGLARNGAGIVEINNGTAGTFADLKLRTLIAPTTTAVGVANVGANSCGTTAASIAGNENIGSFTVGATSGTQCRLAFTSTAPTRRHCVFADETTTIAIRSTYVDTTHSDAIGAFVAGDVVSYACEAR